MQNLVDQSLLKAETTTENIAAAVLEAQKYNYNSICIRPKFVAEFAPQYRISAVIGFPQDFINANNSTARDIISAPTMASKVVEARQALSDGAMELDPVLDISDLAPRSNFHTVYPVFSRDQDLKQFSVVPETKMSFPGDKLRKELQTYMFLIKSHCEERSDEAISTAPSLQAQRGNPATYNLKPIFSCEILSEDEIKLSVQIFAEEVLSFLEQFPEITNRIKFSYKNSTGFIKDRELATPRLIQLIATELDQHDPERIIGIKAAGGVRDLVAAQAVAEAAGSRLTHIGTSAGAGLSQGSAAGQAQY